MIRVKARSACKHGSESLGDVWKRLADSVVRQLKADRILQSQTFKSNDTIRHTGFGFQSNFIMGNACHDGPKMRYILLDYLYHLTVNPINRKAAKGLTNHTFTNDKKSFSP